METGSYPLVSGWKHVTGHSSPYLFPGDEFLLNETSHVALYKSFNEFVRSPDFGISESTKLHLHLVPDPFLGDIENARVYVLMANPGFAPEDYFDSEVSQYFRERLMENLRLRAHNHDFPFLYLDPQLSWRGGFTWWEHKFHTIVEDVVENRQLDYSKALQFLAQHVAALELVPYHSSKFGFDKRLHGRLASVQAATSFLHDFIVPRAKTDEALVIVSRAAKQWGLPTHKNIVQYSAGEARAASISRKTRGGKAILKFLRGIS